MTNDWKGKVCPVMTIGSLAAGARQQSALVGGLGQPKPPEPEAVPCSGPACMWFQPVADEKGNIVSGSCAVALLPLAIAQITQQVTEFKKA